MTDTDLLPDGDATYLREWGRIMRYQADADRINRIADRLEVSTPSSTLANERGDEAIEVFHCPTCTRLTEIENDPCVRCKRKNPQPSPQSDMVAVPREVVEQIELALNRSKNELHYCVFLFEGGIRPVMWGDQIQTGELCKKALSMLQPYTKGEK